MSAKTTTYIRIAATFLTGALVAAVAWVSPFGERQDKRKEVRK